jgi:hypothetical protein
MNMITIIPIIKEPIVRFSGQNVVLPQDTQQSIDAYWQSLVESGKKYTRGEVFTITKIDQKSDNLALLVEKTDYAHYLYCQNIDAELKGYGIRIIFTACLVETSDHKFVFGKMGEHTARFGIYQLAGGGIDMSDLVNEEYFDIQSNINKEVFEELGIDACDSSRVQDFHAAYLKQGGATHKIAVIYHLHLLETAEVFLQKYHDFEKALSKRGETPEFGEIIVIDKDAIATEMFLSEHEAMCDEYMPPLLRYVSDSNVEQKNKV